MLPPKMLRPTFPGPSALGEVPSKSALGVLYKLCLAKGIHLHYGTLKDERSDKSRISCVTNDQATLEQLSDGPHMSIEICETVSTCFLSLAGNFLSEILDTNKIHPNNNAILSRKGTHIE